MRFSKAGSAILDILAIVSEVLESHRAVALPDIDAALEWDGWGRRRATETLSKRLRPR